MSSVAQTLQMLSVISYVIAIICLVFAIFFWIFFKIPVVIGDLSGRTAKKSIAKIRAENEKIGEKKYKYNVNNKLGAASDTIKSSYNVNKLGFVEEFYRPETSLLNENALEISLSDETEILESETTDLLIKEDITEFLVNNKNCSDSYKKLHMIEDIMLINMDDVIE